MITIFPNLEKTSINDGVPYMTAKAQSPSIETTDLIGRSILKMLG
jgi:hypothetical protein